MIMKQLSVICILKPQDAEFFTDYLRARGLHD